MTALHLTAMHGATEAMKVLLKAGADKEAKDKDEGAGKGGDMEGGGGAALVHQIRRQVGDQVGGWTLHRENAKRGSDGVEDGVTACVWDGSPA
eukprot:3331091-Rhodomonas_salina.2